MAIHATEHLANELRAVLVDQTHDDIRDRGGPSSPTLTKLLRADGSVVSLATAKRLEKAFGWSAGTVAAIARGQQAPKRRGISSEQAEGVAEFVRGELDPALADYTDRQLLTEIENRMLFMAAELQTSGHSMLAWAIDPDGDTSLTSGARKR